MTKLPVIYCFARSGGTLVNQLLGIHPDCLVLSEINPSGSARALDLQAYEWVNLITESEVEEFSKLTYSEQINKLMYLSLRKNKKLIIRDWVTINYMPNALASYLVPSNILEQQLYLARLNYDIQSLVITRKAYFVFESLVKNFIQFSSLSLEEFSAYYLTYAKAISLFPKIKLEDLQRSPEDSLIKILNYFNISTNFLEYQLENFSKYNNCTGNNTLRMATESSNYKVVSSNIDGNPKIPYKTNLELQEADYLLGYDL